VPHNVACGDTNVLELLDACVKAFGDPSPTSLRRLIGLPRPMFRFLTANRLMSDPFSRIKLDNPPSARPFSK
jgi:hypothetical protein